LGDIDHKQRQVSGIGHISLGDIHEIFQAPELLGVPEIELVLESQAVIINQQIVRYIQVAAKQDHIGLGLCFQVGSEQNDHVQRVWKTFVEQLHLISAGLEVIYNLGLLQVLVRDLAHIHLLA
jgi:hypothetical protein